MERARAAEFVRNLTLSVTAVACALGAVEACARLADLRPPPTGNVVPAWVDDRQLRREGPWISLLASSDALGRYFELYEWDRFLFYRLRPDIRLEMFDYASAPGIRAETAWDVETNRHGFRGPPWTDDAGDPRPVFRVLALGDSSTFGWGVPEELAYPAVAAAQLQARHPDRRIEVRNLGVPGYSSFQGRVLLERTALPAQPDAVLFSYGANDTTPTGTPDRELYAERSSLLGALQSLLHASRAYETAAAWWIRLRGVEAELPEPLADSLRLNVSREESAENLRRVAALARTRGVEIAFVSNCLSQEAQDLIAGVAREARVPFVDGHASMVRRLPELHAGQLLSEERARTTRLYGALAPYSVYWLYLPDRCHPNRIGHRLIGEAVADVISGWIR